LRISQSPLPLRWEALTERKQLRSPISAGAGRLASGVSEVLFSRRERDCAARREASRAFPPAGDPVHAPSRARRANDDTPGWCVQSRTFGRVRAKKPGLPRLMGYIHKMTAAFTKDDRRDLAFANVGLQVEALLSRSPRLCGPGGKVCRSLSSPPGIVRRRRTRECCRVSLDPA
jgi:hypothetical protein